MLCTPYYNQTTKEHAIKCKCPFCPREVIIAAEGASYIGIMAVHHFNQRHHITKEGILAYAPDYRKAVAEYFD